VTQCLELRREGPDMVQAVRCEITVVDEENVHTTGGRLGWLF